MARSLFSSVDPCERDGASADVQYAMTVTPCRPSHEPQPPPLPQLLHELAARLKPNLDGSWIIDPQASAGHLHPSGRFKRENDPWSSLVVPSVFHGSDRIRPMLRVD